MKRMFNPLHMDDCDNIQAVININNQETFLQDSLQFFKHSLQCIYNICQKYFLNMKTYCVEDMHVVQMKFLF